MGVSRKGLMSPTLGYRRPNAYYVPPRRLRPWRYCLGWMIAIPLAIGGAVLYAKLLSRYDGMIARVVELLFAALGVGLVATIPVKLGEMRSALLRTATGAGLAVLVVYVTWIVWLTDIARRGGFAIGTFDLLTHPSVMVAFGRLLLSGGTYQLFGNLLSGGPLATAWVIEGVVLLLGGMIIPLKWGPREELRCRECGADCPSVGRLPRFSEARRDDLLRAINDRDFGRLLEHDPPADEDDPELLLFLHSCAGCGLTHVFSLERSYWKQTGQGGPRRIFEPLIEKLLLSVDEAEALQKACSAVSKQRLGEKSF